MLFEAVKANASDIHVQPYEDRLMIRMRIDGVLYDSYTLPKVVQEEIISRVKVMGRMNIAEKRLSQDGRATVQIGDRNIDLRIASLPTSYGERVVVRLLDKSARLYELGELGMDPFVLKQFEQLITIEHGLILVTGPNRQRQEHDALLRAQPHQQQGKEHPYFGRPDRVPTRRNQPNSGERQEGMTFASGLRVFCDRTLMSLWSVKSATSKPQRWRFNRR